MSEEAQNDLHEVERLRVQVAEQRRVPARYVGIFGLGVAAMAVGIVLRSRPDLEDFGLWLAFAGVVLASCMPSLLRRRRGVGVPEERGLRYPSGWRNAIVFTVLFVPPLAAAMCLAYATSLFVLAVVCGVLAGIGASIGMWLMYRNMTEDLRRGLVTSK